MLSLSQRLRVFITSVLVFCFLSSGLLQPLTNVANAYEPPLPGPTDPAKDYVQMVLDGNPEITPKTMVVLLKEIRALYEEQSEILPFSFLSQDDFRLDLVTQFQIAEYKKIRLAKASFVDAEAEARRDYEYNLRLYNNIEQSYKDGLAFASLLPYMSVLSVFTDRMRNSNAGSGTSKAMAILENQRLINASALVANGVSSKALKVCQDSSTSVSQRFDCYVAYSPFTENDLVNAMGSLSGAELLLVSSVDFLLKEVAANGHVIKHIPKALNDIVTLDTRLNEVDAKLNALRDAQAVAAAKLGLAAVDFAEVLEGMNSDIEAKGDEHPDTQKNAEFLSAVTTQKGTLAENLLKLKGKCPGVGESGHNPKDICHKRVAELEEIIENQNFKEFKENFDLAVQLGGEAVTLFQNLRNVGVPISDEFIDVASKSVSVAGSIGKAMAVGTSIGGPWGTAAGVLVGLSGVLGIFGGGGPDIEKMRYEAIMGRFDTVINNQKIILDNQKLILDTIVKANQKVIDTLQRVHLQELKVLNELKVVTAANNVALRIEATEGLSRCEAFRSGLEFWKSRDDLTPFQQIDMHFKDYIIDYRECYRDILKFISYNEFNGRFNQWYFISNLATIAEDGTPVIDPSVLESLSLLKNYQIDFLSDSDRERNLGLALAPISSYRGIASKIELSKNVDVKSLIDEKVNEKVFAANIGRFVAPELSQRVAENYLDIYNYSDFISDPDNQSEIASFDEITQRNEISHRTIKLLEQLHDILEVTIAQQSLLSGDVLLGSLLDDFDPKYTVASTVQERDVLGRISQGLAVDQSLNANHLIVSNRLILENAVRSKLYKVMDQKGLNHASYAFAHATEDPVLVSSLVDDFFEIRKTTQDDEFFYEVHINMSDSSNPNSTLNVDTWVRLPEPDEVLEQRLLVPPNMENLTQLRERLEVELSEIKAFAEIESLEERKNTTLGFLLEAN